MEEQEKSRSDDSASISKPSVKTRQNRIRKSVEDLVVAVIGAFKKGIVHAITAAAAGALVYFGVPSHQVLSPSVVPPVNAQAIDKTTPNSDLDFRVIRDISVFDLRSWTPTTKNDARYSPANYINYLTVRKIREARQFRAQYATTGYAIDLRCVSHKFQLYRVESNDETKTKTYEIAINVSDLPINSEFLIVIEGTYWNGFRNVSEESASTYTTNDIDLLQELSLILLLPKDKPIQSASLLTAAEQRVLAPYSGESIINQDPDGRYLYWRIPRPKQHSEYTVKWRW
jgi:hypothetical protein